MFSIIVYKELEHLWIQVSMGVLEPISHRPRDDCSWALEKSKDICGFSTVWRFGASNPNIVNCIIVPLFIFTIYTHTNTHIHTYMCTHTYSEENNVYLGWLKLCCPYFLRNIHISWSSQNSHHTSNVQTHSARLLCFRRRPYIPHVLLMNVSDIFIFCCPSLYFSLLVLNLVS